MMKESYISFGSILTILFIALKLTGHITWSWLWVLSPLWISALSGLILIGLVYLIWQIYKMFKTMPKRKRK